MYFSCNVSFASLPVFLPTILAGMGYSNINSQGLTAPPYFLSFLFCIGTTYIADRTKQRGLMIIFLSLMGGTGYAILALVLRQYLVWQNNQADIREGAAAAAIESDEKNGIVGVENEGFGYRNIP